MIVDYHMHLRNEDEELEHTVEAVERFVDKARERGLDEIGFTEHVYYFRQTEHIWDVPYHTERCAYDIEPYVQAILEAKRQGMPVKLGLEVDWQPAKADELREVLGQYPWDYLLGSIHFIDGLGVDGEPQLVEEVGVEEAWRRYFSALADAAASGLFDALAHPDLVKIFGRRAANEGAAFEPFLDSLNGGVALEVSSAGLHKPVGELYPAPELLAGAKQRSIPITLASDAHVPQNVGRDLGRAVEHVRAAGYDTVTVFEVREARQEPLG